MPLSLRVPRRRADTDAPVDSVVRSMEEGDTRLKRAGTFNTARLRKLLMRASSERMGKPAETELDIEISAASTGSIDYELHELQDMLQEQPSTRGWDKFRSLWEPQELENSLKEMLRVAGCPLRILEAVKREDNEQLTELFGSDAGDELSLVEEEVGMMAGCLFSRPKLVKKFLKSGVSVALMDKDGRTPLHLAAFSGNVEIVRRLVKHGANVNAVDARQNTTPLICASAVSASETVAFLLAHGADVNAGLDPDDATALHYAVRANSIACVEQLLRVGASTRGAHPKSETPLHVAADYGFDKCLQLLLNHGAEVDAVCGTACKTPLLLAAEDGSVQCARLLHDYRARLDPQTNRGQTALHLAAKAQSAEMIELLLSWGADINTRDHDLRTPLHCSITKESRSLDHIKILINHGASINEGDMAGYTPIHLAAINEYSSCVELLMDHGGDVTLRNRGGVSCLQLIRHRTPSVLAKLPERFSRAIVFYEREGMLADKFSELKINFKPLMSKAKGECHFLKALIDIDQKHLLKHPLCESFLHMKWMKVRKFLFVNMLFYLLFCILLSVYVLGTSHGNCHNMGLAVRRSECRDAHSHVILPDELIGLGEQCKGKNASVVAMCRVNRFGIINPQYDMCVCTWSGIQLRSVLHPSSFTLMWYVLVVFDVILLAKEVFQLVQDPPQYFRNPENIAEWALMFFVLLIGTPVLGYVEVWQKHLGAIAIVVCWSELMMLVGRLPRLGLYIHMFSKVLKDFFHFLLAFCSLLVGCAVSFVVLFPLQKPFSDSLHSILKVLVMMTGELEFADLFYGDDQDILNPTASVVFIIFVFLLTIILMNLLVGLAVSDIQGLQRTAKLGRLVHLTEEISHIEGTLFSSAMTRFLPEKVCKWIVKRSMVSPSAYRYTLVVRPNDPNDTRLTPEIMKSACDVAKLHAKESRRSTKLRRQWSALTYDYDLIQSVQETIFEESAAHDNSSSAEVMMRDSRLAGIETKLEMTESALRILLVEVRTIALALNAQNASSTLASPVAAGSSASAPLAPRVTIREPEEEDRDSFAFASESVEHQSATPSTSLESNR